MSEHVLPPARRETKDIGFVPMLIAGALMLGMLFGIAMLVLWLYPEALRGKELALPLPRFAEPVLQTSPPADMHAFYAEEMQRLRSTGWIEKVHGVVHIPIQDAMRDVARDGIADWPTPARKPVP